MRLKSSLCYTIAMAAPAVHCLWGSEIAEPFALITAFASILAASLLGFWLGAWYLPVQGERAGFELVACPVIIAIFAPVLGTASTLLWMYVSIPEARGADLLVALIPLSTYGMLFFLSLSWPALVISFSLAGLVLARSKHRQLAG